ncbi:MAG: polysaccharide biosynthesis C-terminal domain-containing protein [Erysipelotrichaceae bacterium]|nr:polysaccharide biosynthesis C-terminal domain-containing protein [Erysipelotrichaceae bacterium]
MDFLNDEIKPIYYKYLAAAFGSSLISCIYGVVDMAMVGQYQGPNGTAALAIVAPIWNVIYSLGLLMGIGGSVLYSMIKGQDNKKDNPNDYFSAAVIGSIILGFICWILIILFDETILNAFGATVDTLELARAYIFPIKFVFPCFLFNQMLAAFLRNDNDPTLATIAIIAGGIFNMIGDYFFVFVCDKGIQGAGIATGLGALISFIVMLTHFVKRTNTLSFKIPKQLSKKIYRITINGFSSFFIDVAMGFLTILFNRQIVLYLNTNALSVYSVVINISTFVQCCAYAVGQASQPIISMNYGADKNQRIKKVLKYAISSVAVVSIIWTILIEVFPNLFIYIYMAPTNEILQMAPAIMRIYALSFILLPLNIFSTYYFQSIMKPNISFIVSITRGIIISGILIILLPIINVNAIWLAMPITELIVAIYVVMMIKHYTN